MELEQAKEIVQACVHHTMHKMGIIEEQPPSLYEYSLRELLDANDQVKADNDSRRDLKGPQSFQTVCDDRLVSALYTLYHFDGDQNGGRVEPIALANGKALICIRVTPEMMEKEADGG
jgi:hypothetical protein